MVSEKTIQQAAALLSEKFHPDRIILFGSYARGTADRHSDVDLLVITKAVSTKNRVKLMSEMSGEIDKLSFPKDIVVLTPEEFEVDKDIPGTIARYAAKEGCFMSVKKSAVAKKAKEWLLHADEDLQLAKHAFKLKTSAPFKLIAYHAQQCSTIS